MPHGPSVQFVIKADGDAPAVAQAVSKVSDLLDGIESDPPSLDRIDTLALRLEDARRHDPLIRDLPIRLTTEAKEAEISAFFSGTRPGARLDDRELAAALRLPSEHRDAILAFRTSQAEEGETAHRFIRAALDHMPMQRMRALFHYHAANIGEGDVLDHYTKAHALAETPALKSEIDARRSAYIAAQQAHREQRRSENSSPSSSIFETADGASGDITGDSQGYVSCEESKLGESSPTHAALESDISEPADLVQTRGAIDAATAPAPSNLAGSAASIAASDSPPASDVPDYVHFDDRTDEMRELARTRARAHFDRAQTTASNPIGALLRARRYAEFGEDERLGQRISLELARRGYLPVQNAQHAIMSGPSVNAASLAQVVLANHLPHQAALRLSLATQGTIRPQTRAVIAAAAQRLGVAISST